jgi:copper chaperone NosL
MDRRRTGVALLALAAGCRMRVAAGAVPAATAVGAGAFPQPGPRDLCPVCGMLVAKYPAWVAGARYRDGRAHFFDGAKDLFKYLFDLQRYAPGRRREDLADVWVTEFYGLTRVDARQAWYVIGSDILGPMGHEFVPLASRQEAAEFLRDHQGKRILAFAEITAEWVERIDRARFES